MIVDSNIPSKMFYSAFGIEILRSARTTNYATIFQRNYRILINRMMRLGAKTDRLSTIIDKLFGRQ